MAASKPSAALSIVLLLAASTASGGCGGSTREARWSASAHLASAPMSRGYCSPSYQARFGWPDPAKAAKVCRCESGGDPRAVSHNRLYAGLFQFSQSTWRSVGGGDPFDPATNSEHAYRLFLHRGWRPWPTCGR